MTYGCAEVQVPIIFNRHDNKDTQANPLPVSMELHKAQQS